MIASCVCRSCGWTILYPHCRLAPVLRSYPCEHLSAQLCHLIGLYSLHNIMLTSTKNISDLESFCYFFGVSGSQNAPKMLTLCMIVVSKFCESAEHVMHTSP